MKKIMPSGRTLRARYLLFSGLPSYIDVPPQSRFVEIQLNHENRPVLLCEFQGHATQFEWRRVVPVPVDSDRRPYAGWTNIPSSSKDFLWFLDPQVYDHNREPVAS